MMDELRLGPIGGSGKFVEANNGRLMIRVPSRRNGVPQKLSEESKRQSEAVQRPQADS